MSTPRTLACGNSRAKSSAPSPVPVPTSSARSGAGFTCRSAAASGARCSTEPGAGAPVPAGRRAIEEAPHRAADRRPGPGRAHDQPVQHAADDPDPPRRGPSLRRRHQARRPRLARRRIHIGHLAVPRCAPSRPASLRGRCHRPRPPERSPRASPSPSPRSRCASCGGGGGDSTSAALPAGCKRGAQAAAQARQPEAAAQSGSAEPAAGGRRRHELRQVRDRARQPRIRRRR